MTVKASEIVADFCKAWSAMDFDRVIGALSDDIFYHNIPLDPIAGKDHVRTYLSQAWTFDHCKWTILNIASNGDTVLTERTDDFWFGDSIVSLPVMGVFEIENARIKVWRDYFDLADYRNQLTAAKRER